MKQLIQLVCVTLLLGGCMMSDRMEPKGYTDAEIKEGGVIDVEKALASGYMPYEETANDIKSNRNPKATAYIEAHYDELEALIKPYIEEALGREIEITAMRGSFPYMAADVDYKTTSFPVIYMSTVIGLEDNIALDAGGVMEIDQRTVWRKTVDALYNYAYEEEWNEMRAYYAAKYPQYMPTIIPSQEADIQGEQYPYIHVTIASPGGETQPAYDAKRQAVYDAYLANPGMSREELRELFTWDTPLFTRAAFIGYERDLTKLPTEEEAQVIFDDLATYDYHWLNTPRASPVVYLGTNLRQNKSKPLYYIEKNY